MASPFFFMKKKDGKLRPCQYYWFLNDWTIKNAYPLPLISEIMNKLKGTRYFTKLDVRWGYNNIWEGDKWKAAFKQCLNLNFIHIKALKHFDIWGIKPLENPWKTPDPYPWPLGVCPTLAHCQDPNTKSILLRSNRFTIHHLSFILCFIFYYLPYNSLLTFFCSIPVRLLTSPFYQHCYTWIIKHQLWLHSDFMLSKQWMFHSENWHSYIILSYFIILYMFHFYLGI